LPKIPCALLVIAQIAWSTDIPFFPTHAMLRDTPLRTFIGIAASGFQGRDRRFFDIDTEWSDIAAVLPKDAHVLIHENQMHFGIQRETLSDQPQTGIDYIEDWSPELMYDHFLRLGVTHIVTNGRISKSLDAFGGDVAFFNFVTQYAVDARTVGGHVVYRMPDSRPRSKFRGRVLWGSCGSYKNGVYDVRGLSYRFRYGADMSKEPFPPPLFEVKDPAAGSKVLAEVDAVVNNGGCFPFPESLASAGFVDVASRDGAQIWVRSARGR
jgi:hypothetical protein